MKKICLGLLFLMAATVSQAASVSVITKETLKDWMENSSVIVLDARQGRDWSSSEFKIQSAVRAQPNQFSDWKTQYAKDQKLVIYCA